MKRLVLKMMVCGCALIAAAAAAAPAAATTKPRSAVTSVCETSSKAADRKITVETTMRPVTGSMVMQQELLLQERPSAGGAYKTITLPTQTDFGTWLTLIPEKLAQNPNDVWHVNKTETRLVRGYSFRVKVKFRWWGKGTDLLRQQTRYTKACAQPQASTGDAE